MSLVSRSPFSLFAWLILLVVLGTASHPKEWRQGKDRALFFAVSNYAHSGLTDLTQPVENARAIAGVLEERYDFTIEIVTDPSLEQITDKLLAYQNNYATGAPGFDPNGQLLIFFSGHGIKEYGAGYFLPADANPDLVIGTGLAYNNWRGFIDNINCRHILVAIDACYSVTFDPNWQSMGDGDSDRFRRKGALSESERLLAAHNDHPARLFYTSDAQEDVVPGRSNFARKLLEGLSEYRGSQPYLTAEELFASYVKRAQPTPNAGDFGKDDPRSSFLFFPKVRVNIGDARADYAAWQAAERTNTLPAYRQYLSDYPNGDFLLSAKEKIVALDAEERELLAWREVKSRNTSHAYSEFLLEYPNSRYQVEADAALRNLKVIGDSDASAATERQDTMTKGSRTARIPSSYTSNSNSYMVQLAAYTNPKYFDRERASPLGDIVFKSRGRLTVAIVSNISTLQQARSIRQQARSAGWAGAFIVQEQGKQLIKVE